MSWLTRTNARQATTPLPYIPQAYRKGGGALSDRLYVSNELQSAVKSMPYSQYVQDFIQGSGAMHELYNEIQLESAYKTSVYLFAGMRKVANLASQLQIVGEIERDGKWERLPDTSRLNKMFADAGSRFIFEMVIYYMLYGKVLIYKRKTAKGVLDWERNKAEGKDPSVSYLDKQIAGMHIIPNAYWELVGDDWTGEIDGFTLTTGTEDITGDNRQFLAREEVVYSHDFDPRDRNGATSMASLAINNAITNAAIARWSAHYFMSGAMPLLLISTDDPTSGMMEEVETAKYKNFVERAWQGLWGRFSMRAVFTNRKLNVQEAGISADKVQAPELDRSALNNIASVLQLAPDLIVPPEGGSDNARHKFLILQAYSDAVLPLISQMLTDINHDFGFDGKGIRLVIDEDQIKALEAERAERSATEIAIYQSGVQKFSEIQDALNLEPIEELADFIMTGEGLKSIERVLREDSMVSDKLATVLQSAWEGNAITLSEYRNALGFNTPPSMKDGFKFQVIPAEGGGGNSWGGGGGEPEPPSSPPAPQLPVPHVQQTLVANTNPSVQRGNDSTDKPTVAQTAPTNVSSRQLVANATQTPQNVPTLAVDAPQHQRGMNVLAFADIEVREPLFTALMVNDDPLIEVVQRKVAERMTDATVQWIDPAHWHVTMVYVLDANDDKRKLVRKMMPMAFTDIKLRAVGLRCFDDGEQIAICLDVERDSALVDAQEKVFIACRTYMLPTSAYSEPADWNPHITIGYAPKGTTIPVLKFSVIIEPKALVIARDDWQVVDSIPVFQNGTAYMNSLGASYEPDGSNMLIEANSTEAIEDALVSITRYRAFMRSALRAWLTDGVAPDDAPKAINRCVNEALAELPLDATLRLALLAVDRGLFDPDNSIEENPILVIQRSKKSMQKTAQQELEAWRKSAKSSVKKAGKFELNLIPYEVELYVKAKLAEGADVTQTFNEADVMLQDLTVIPETTANDLVAWGEAMLDDTDDDDLQNLLVDDDDDTEPTG